MKETLQYIKEQITPIRDKSPVLLIGNAAINFKSGYTKEIYTINNKEDAENLVETYSELDIDTPIIVEGISNVTNLSVFLKFLEETHIPIILLCLEDNSSLNDVFLSRITTIVKMPFVLGTNNMLPSGTGLDIFKEQCNLQRAIDNDRRRLEDKISATESSEYYYMRNKASRYVCDDKIVDLLSGGI